MNYRERGSYARGVYKCMETARVKKEEEVDTRLIVK